MIFGMQNSGGMLVSIELHGSVEIFKILSGLFKLRNPPLFQIRDKQGGVSYESPRSPKFPPCGGLKIAKTLIFGRFSKFQNPKNFRDKQGGFLIKGGFLNLNTPDVYVRARTSRILVWVEDLAIVITRMGNAMNCDCVTRDDE